MRKIPKVKPCPLIYPEIIVLTEVRDPDGRKLSHILISAERVINRHILFLSQSETSQSALSPLLLPLKTVYPPTFRDHGRNTKAPQPKVQKAGRHSILVRDLTQSYLLRTC